VSIRRLFAILLALAVLFAPAVTASASAAEPSHDMRMRVGHCQGLMPGSPDKNAGKTCCISICMGVALSPLAPEAETSVQIASPVFAAPLSLTGQPTELPTPPPRLS